jgi:peptidyl-prolyl cis-trans isomerase C
MLRRALAVASLVAVAACGSGKSAPAKKGPIVAEGGGIKVTADEFKARLDEQSPMIRASFNNLDRKKQFLDNMLRFELLAQAAEKDGLANDPDVQFTMKKVMVSKYYQKFFAPDADPLKSVPEGDVKKYYDDHREEFHRPARVHVAHVLFAAKEGTPDRAKKAADAKKALAKLLADEKKNPGAFAALAREASDDASTKSMGGDLSLRSQDELTQQFGKPFADASFQLADNQTSPAVVESPQGFHLVRALGRQAEVNRPFDDVKVQIATKLSSQKKTKEFDEFVKKLRETASVKINDAELEKVAVAGPGTPPGGAPHGMGGPVGAVSRAPAMATPVPAAPAAPAPATPAPAAPAK